jgi:hypothetical protein
MAFGAPSLKGRALRLLSQREHSRAELERKLARHEEEPGTLARALDELAAKDFISEERVVQSVLHQRASRVGAARVRQELHHKGIAPEARQPAGHRSGTRHGPVAPPLRRGARRCEGEGEADAIPDGARLLGRCRGQGPQERLR